MSKILVIILTLLTAVAWADDRRADEIVGRLAEKFRAMKSYGADFEIEVGDQTSKGRFVVSDGRYYMTIGTAEAYGDTKLRREVDNVRREVVVDVVMPQSHVMLENPVRAFDYIDKDYRPELVTENEEETVVKLHPSEGSHSMQWYVVTLTLDKELTPREICYESEGDESIRVRLLRVAAGDEGFKTYEAKNYKGYEIIDFR